MLRGDNNEHTAVEEDGIVWEVVLGAGSDEGSEEERVRVRNGEEEAASVGD